MGTKSIHHPYEALLLFIVSQPQRSYTANVMISLKMSVCSLVHSGSYQILLRHGAESPQKDAYNGHMIVASCHMQTRLPQLETEGDHRLTFNEGLSKDI